MRFTCEKSLLLQGLNVASRTVAVKSSLTLIEGILCRAGLGVSLTSYNMETGITCDIPAEVVEPGAYDEMLARHPVYFFGDGAEKCKSVITHPNAHFIDNIQPLAKNMSPLAEKRLITRQTEDVAYFEPFYLKDFVAIKPRKTL